MRVVSVYYSFDDREFFDYQECADYEVKAFRLMLDFFNTFVFYDKDKKEVEIVKDTVEDMLASADWAIQSCDYVRVNKPFDSDTEEFIRVQIGADLPDEVGFYKYDYYGEFGGGWQRWVS